MINVDIELKNHIDWLLGVLDDDLENLEKNISRLVELKELVIKREEGKLQELLNKIKNESGEVSKNEARREKIRKQIADLLKLEPSEVTLTSLMQIVSDEYAEKIRYKQKQLMEMSYELKKEHLSTALLLKDMSRLNHMILNSIFDRSKQQGVTYNSAGGAKRESGSNFMNMKL